MSLTPPPPLWTDMDNWETPSLPLPVHVVYECRHIKKECIVTEYISTQPKELYLCGNSSSTNIKTEISDKTEELQSDLTFLCDSELELDQIPIF